MDQYQQITPIWDLSQSTDFSQLPDDDFLALLQKQFPDSNALPYTNDGFFPDGINPQSITPFALPGLSPSSEDSSPSPPNINEDPGSRSQSEKLAASPKDHDEHDHDPALKRKASDEEFEDGPSSKSQHTCMFISYRDGSPSFI
jgi:AP-1-like factor